MNEITKEHGKKRGRKPKNEKKEYSLNVEQTKFYVDLSEDKVSLDLAFNLLKKANEKTYGHEITFKDIVIYAASKLNEKDIEKIQEGSLSEMEKVDRAREEFNKKNGLNLTMGEFLIKKLGIN